MKDILLLLTRETRADAHVHDDGSGGLRRDGHGRTVAAGAVVGENALAALFGRRRQLWFLKGLLLRDQRRNGGSGPEEERKERGA